MELMTLMLGWSAWLMPAVGSPPGPELLQPPREVRIETVVIPVVPIDPFYQPDPYWRMRLYAPDRYGRLRPRVIYGPHGPYYPLTGEPYLYLPVKGLR